MTTLTLVETTWANRPRSSARTGLARSYLRGGSYRRDEEPRGPVTGCLFGSNWLGFGQAHGMAGMLLACRISHSPKGVQGARDGAGFCRFTS
jgi:hypothetical protein